MNFWFPVEPNRASKHFRIPREIAEDDSNSFYSSGLHPESNRFDMDGPWQLVALLRDREHPQIFTFSVHTIDPQFLDIDGYNPLTFQTGGYLSLNKRSVSELIVLLEKSQTRLTIFQETPQVAFEQVVPSEFHKYHLKPDLLPKSQVSYHLQRYDPAALQDKGEYTTLLIFSMERRLPSTHLFFQIARFPSDALKDSSYDPTDHSHSRIHLDVQGNRELISLLETQRRHLAD